MPTDTEKADSFSKGRDQEHAFKNQEIMVYACAFVKAALDLRRKGIDYVGSDDVPESAIPGHESPGIAGSAITMLRNASVIEDFFENRTNATPPVYGGRRKSKRESANGRKIGLYSLVSVAIAEAFLTRNGQSVVKDQYELVLK